MFELLITCSVNKTSLIVNSIKTASISKYCNTVKLGNPNIVIP